MVNKKINPSTENTVTSCTRLGSHHGLLNEGYGNGGLPPREYYFNNFFQSTRSYFAVHPDLQSSILYALLPICCSEEFIWFQCVTPRRPYIFYQRVDILCHRELVYHTHCLVQMKLVSQFIPGTVTTELQPRRHANRHHPFV